MLCAGTSFHTFLIGRALQGASAAMVWTAGLALLADNVEKEELGQCLGYVTMAMNAGTLLGPLSGGIVYDKGGYFAVYDIGFALIGLDVVLRFVLIEKKTARKYMAGTADPNHDPLLPQPALDEDEGIRSSYGTVNVTNAGSESLKTSSNQRSVWQRRLPAIIWLLSSRRLLVALLASMMWGIILTSFDAVSVILTQSAAQVHTIYFLVLLATIRRYLFCHNLCSCSNNCKFPLGSSPVRNADFWLVIQRERSHLHRHSSSLGLWTLGRFVPRVFCVVAHPFR